MAQSIDTSDLRSKLTICALSYRLATSADGLGDIDVKANQAARLVLEGKSIATALGEFKNAQGQPLDALGVAKTTFNLAESQIYNLWERGCKPPYVEWVNDSQASTGEKRKAVGESSRQLDNGSQRRRTETGAYTVKPTPRLAALGIHPELLLHGLAEVYGKPYSDVHMADLNSFAASYPNVLPLITARARFVSVRDGSLIDSGVRNARHLAEHDAARRVADRLDEQLRSVMNRARTHAALVAANIEVIRERARALAPGPLADLTVPITRSSNDVQRGMTMEDDDVSIYDTQTQRMLESQVGGSSRLRTLPPASQQRLASFAPRMPLRPAASQRSEYFTPSEARAQSSAQHMRAEPIAELESSATHHHSMASRDFARPMHSQAGPSSTPGKKADSDRTLGASEVEAEREREQEAQRRDFEVESQLVTAEELQSYDALEREAIEKEQHRRISAEKSSPIEEEQEQRMPSEHRGSSEQLEEHWPGDRKAEGSQHSDDDQQKQRGSSVVDDMADEERHAQEVPSLGDLLASVRPERQGEQQQQPQQEQQQSEERQSAPRSEQHSPTRSERTETIEGGASSIWARNEESRAAAPSASPTGKVSQFSALPPRPPSPRETKQKPPSMLAIPQVQETVSTSGSQYDELNETPSQQQQHRSKAKKLSFATKKQAAAQQMAPPSPSQNPKLGDQDMSPPSSTSAARGGDTDAPASREATPSKVPSSAQIRQAVGAGKLSSFLTSGRRPTASSGSTGEAHKQSPAASGFSATMPSSSSAASASAPAHSPRNMPLAAHENRTYQQQQQGEASLDVEDVGPQPGKARSTSAEPHAASSPAFAFDENGGRKGSANRHGFPF